MNSLRRRVAKLDKKSSMADFLRSRLPELRADIEAGRVAPDGLAFVLRFIDALDPPRKPGRLGGESV